MDEVTRAYIAGYFDGEGNAGATRTRRSSPPRARIQIVQRDRTPLDAIRDELGYGTVHKQQSGVHCLLIAGSADVIRFADLVLPYTRQKRQQLTLAHELASLVMAASTDDRPRREEIAHEFAVLSGRA